MIFLYQADADAVWLLEVKGLEKLTMFPEATPKKNYVGGAGHCPVDTGNCYPTNRMNLQPENSL